MTEWPQAWPLAYHVDIFDPSGLLKHGMIFCTLCQFGLQMGRCLFPEETMAARSGKYCQLMKCPWMTLEAHASQHSRLLSLNLFTGHFIVPKFLKVPLYFNLMSLLFEEQKKSTLREVNSTRVMLYSKLSTVQLQDRGPQHWPSAIWLYLQPQPTSPGLPWLLQSGRGAYKLFPWHLQRKEDLSRGPDLSNSLLSLNLYFLLGEYLTIWGT